MLALTKRYQERGWGEVSETSYHAFLLWLEETLNNEFVPTGGLNSIFGRSTCTPSPSNRGRLTSPVSSPL